MPLTVAGATGLEPAASGVTGRRSNQLSYAPVVSARGVYCPHPCDVKAIRLPAYRLPETRHRVQKTTAYDSVVALVMPPPFRVCAIQMEKTGGR